MVIAHKRCLEFMDILCQQTINLIQVFTITNTLGKSYRQ